MARKPRSDEPRTVRDLADRWDDLIPRPDPETAAHNRSMVQAFVALHGEKRLEAVTVFMARQFAVKHPSSVRYVKTFFADAVRLGLLEESPFAGVSPPRSEGRAAVDPPTYAQVLAVAQHAEPNFADFILTAAFTGLRLTELAKVEARDVLSDTRLLVRQGKGTTRDYPVTMFKHARDIVWRRKPEVGLVFTDVGGRRWDRRKVSRCWGAVRTAAGIEDSFRCTRNFHATWLVDQGAQPLDVAVQLRHFDKHGRPYLDLVLGLYAKAGANEALSRLEALA